MSAVTDAFAEQLSERLDTYWAVTNDFLWEVSNRFGSADDWDDPQEGAYFLWRKAGWNPDLLLPRPSLRNPRKDERFRSCVAFGDISDEWWQSHSTAVFFATLDWSALQPGNLIVMPSLGQTAQWASGLMGSLMLELKDPRPKKTRGSSGNPHRETWSYFFAGWDFCASTATPIWSLLARFNNRDPDAESEIPDAYHDDFSSMEHGCDDAEEFLVSFLPDDLRSPFATEVASVVSYSLGWLALTHGLKALVDEWQGINEVMATAPLQGFVEPL